jgi:hypothetical protein
MDLHGVAMVTRAGIVRTERAAGLADAEAGTPCTLQTRYGYGMFTGTFDGQATYYHPGVTTRATCPSRAGYRTGRPASSSCPTTRA